VKIAAVNSYGGNITYVKTELDCESCCEDMVANTRAIYVPPGNHQNVFLGAGTTMYEFQQQMSTNYQTKLDAIVVPIGVGGLISGCALACIDSGTLVFGAEPVLASQCALRLKGGEVHLASASSTIADELRVGVADATFDIIKKLSVEVFTVTEEQIANAMRIIFKDLRLAVEPSAAVALAVILFHDGFKTKLKDFRNVGIILEGGNVDTSKIESYMPWLGLGNA